MPGGEGGGSYASATSGVSCAEHKPLKSLTKESAKKAVETTTATNFIITSPTKRNYFKVLGTKVNVLFIRAGCELDNEQELWDFTVFLTRRGHL